MEAQEISICIIAALILEITTLTAINKNKSGIQEFLGRNFVNDQRYSDENLIKKPHMLHEAIALAWIGNKFPG